MHRFVSALVALMLGVSAVTSRAAEQSVLPAFELASPEGNIVASSALSNEPRWLLIYVSAGCGSCDRLVAALETWRPTLPPGRIIVVIAAPRDRALVYSQQHAYVAASSWYADADGQGARALGLQHEPALVAIENGRVAWTITGVLNDPAALEPIIRNWTVR
jgi:hypothetical protein